LHIAKDTSTDESDSSVLETTEIVLVIAEAGDSTLAIAKSFENKFPNIKIIYLNSAVGKGRDIQIGMLAASGELRIFMDADLATPLHHLETVFRKWQESKFDVLIGIRNLQTIHSELPRRIISFMGNIVFFFVSGFYIKDTQCGFKTFSKEATEVCFSRLTRMSWSFDMELLIIARVHKLQVKELLIPDWKDVPGGTFRSTLSHFYQFFTDLLFMFYYRMIGKYR
jgi:dolichyl-phosphate beta-glucosyltransferase